MAAKLRVLLRETRARREAASREAAETSFHKQTPLPLPLSHTHSHTVPQVGTISQPHTHKQVEIKQSPVSSLHSCFIRKLLGVAGLAGVSTHHDQEGVIPRTYGIYNRVER